MKKNRIFTAEKTIPLTDFYQDLQIFLDASQHFIQIYKLSSSFLHDNRIEVFADCQWGADLRQLLDNDFLQQNRILNLIFFLLRAYAEQPCFMPIISLDNILVIDQKYKLVPKTITRFFGLPQYRANFSMNQFSQTALLVLQISTKIPVVSLLRAQTQSEFFQKVLERSEIIKYKYGKTIGKIIEILLKPLPNLKKIQHLIKKKIKKEAITQNKLLSNSATGCSPRSKLLTAQKKINPFEGKQNKQEKQTPKRRAGELFKNLPTSASKSKLSNVSYFQEIELAVDQQQRDFMTLKVSDTKSIWLRPIPEEGEQSHYVSKLV